jgi:hypothetical protein
VAPDTTSDYNIRIAELCCSLLKTERGAAMFNGKAATMELT